jgi:excisionase family DNA binding protein
MRQVNNNLILDSRPLVVLTEAELRELLRQEICAAFSKHVELGGNQNSLTQNLSSVTNPYLTVKEAAELTRLATSTIRLYIRKGQLKAQRVGSRVILSRAEVEKFLGCSDKVVDVFPT